MDFQPTDYIFPVIPQVLGLRHAFDVSAACRDAAIASGMTPDEAPPLAIVPTFHLLAVTAADVDRSNREFSAYRIDHNQDQVLSFGQTQQVELERSKFVRVENLSVGGVPIAGYDDFIARAPAELVNWYRQIIYSYQALSEAERKNSLPGYGTACGPPSIPASSTAKNATTGKRKPATAATGKG